jgi:biotin carboxyl carrier protein
MTKIFEVHIRDTSYTVSLREDGTIEVNGFTHRAELRKSGPAGYSLILDGKSYRIHATHKRTTAESDGTQSVWINGTEYTLQVYDQKSRLLRSFVNQAKKEGGNIIVHAPMPGLVSKIEVKVGDTVTAGQGLLILEAMKMENEVKSTGSGRISQVHIPAGTAVEKGAALITIVP